MKLGPSLHLSWDELGCHDGTPYPVDWRETRAVDLAQEFERIRGIVGGPIPIDSAYRTEAYNVRVGGVKNSQHCQGRALDLRPPIGMPLDLFYDAIREYADSPGSKIWGLGRYPIFVHIDIRPEPDNHRLVVWRGSRAWAETKSA